MENIQTDVHELEKGMEIVRKEVDFRGKCSQSIVLRDFLSNSEEKLKKLKSDVKAAQEAFRECVEYFAESTRTTDANTFFSLLVRFAKAFKVCCRKLLKYYYFKLLKYYFILLFPFNRVQIKKMNKGGG